MARVLAARLTVGLLTVILASLGWAATAGPALAAAEPMGDCTTTSGVVVAVDFAHFGGPVLRACGSTPTTAYDLLNQGGWDTTGTEHDGPGFICRIGYAGFDSGTQYPTSSQQSCVLTPPASAYWAFWYANPGQNTWSYSQAGAMSQNAEPGSVELWVFGGTSSGGTSGSAVPTVSPGSLRATNRASGGAVNSGHADRATASPRETTPASAPATPAKSPTARATGAGATPAGRTSVQNAPPTTAVAAASGGHGSAAPAIIALVIVLVLAAVGIVAVLRRPRRER
jgi:hypothetical protein